MAKRAAFEIAGQTIEPGNRATVALDIGRLYTHTHLELVAEVIHGRKDGPVLLVCAAIHGDELNGVEICRQLMKRQALERLRGTLIIVPVVNIFGFLHHSRYMPDRRDLNRCFPGSERGSMGARFANCFVKEVLHKSSHVIDLHTGAVHRSNLPQVRANLDDPVVRQMAESFGAPVMLNAALRDGSLRGCADDAGIPLILYEAGEALRFNDYAIKTGLAGVINVMRDLQMLPPVRRKNKILCEEARTSGWVRAELDGTCRFIAQLGQRVKVGDQLATIASPFSPQEQSVLAPWAGIIIGRNNIPLVNEGDALFHVARFETLGGAERSVEAFRETLGDTEYAFDQTEALPENSG
ncbi:succinylglutamate desuccinylase/aspartoacylase family protein [Marinobacterium jannaschii]